MNKPVRTEVIGIASGKGGVGKTTIAVNLAIALRQKGYRVMLFDGDLGLANAQIAMGCTCPYNLGHFLSGQKTLQEITVMSRHGVLLIPGSSGAMEMAALSELQASRIVQAFSALEVSQARLDDQRLAEDARRFRQHHRKAALHRGAVGQLGVVIGVTQFMGSGLGRFGRTAPVQQYQ